MILELSCHITILVWKYPFHWMLGLVALSICLSVIVHFAFSIRPTGELFATVSFTATEVAFLIAICAAAVVLIAYEDFTWFDSNIFLG